MSKKYPVIIIHGLFSPRITIEAFGRPLRRDGFMVHSVCLPPLNFCSIKKSAAKVDRKVRFLIEEKGYEKVHVIGMSLGGVIAYAYAKMFESARLAQTIVSIGGPLNGTLLADIISLVPLLGWTPAIREITRSSELMQELRQLPAPAGVRLISIGAPGDPFSPERAYSVPDVRIIHTPHAHFPSKHHMLYLHPKNYAILRDELLAESDV
jgi:pimeloyl-ACP methyl ester carboxylesterase